MPLDDFRGRWKESVTLNLNFLNKCRYLADSTFEAELQGQYKKGQCERHVQGQYNCTERQVHLRTLQGQYRDITETVQLTVQLTHYIAFHRFQL